MPTGCRELVRELRHHKKQERNTTRHGTTRMQLMSCVSARAAVDASGPVVAVAAAGDGKQALVVVVWKGGWGDEPSVKQMPHSPRPSTPLVGPGRLDTHMGSRHGRHTDSSRTPQHTCVQIGTLSTSDDNGDEGADDDDDEEEEDDDDEDAAAEEEAGRCTVDCISCSCCCCWE